MLPLAEYMSYLLLTYLLYVQSDDKKKAFFLTGNIKPAKVIARKAQGGSAAGN